MRILDTHNENTCLIVKYGYSCQILMKLEFSGKIPGKAIKIPQIYFSVSSGDVCREGERQTVGLTDRHNEANS